MPIALKKKLRQAYKPVAAPVPKKAGLAPVKPKPTVPAAPSKPPPGYYDPALDAAERASGRGLGDLRIDTETANQRASTDYVQGTSALAQRFRDLGAAQTSGGVAANGGIVDASSIRAGAARRGQNQKLEQDSLGQQYQYGVDDRALQVQRAEREGTLFSADTADQRSFQAAAAGYVPPAAPAAAKPKAVTAGLTPAQKKLVDARTTASSKQRLADKLRAENKKKGK